LVVADAHLARSGRGVGHLGDDEDLGAAERRHADGTHDRQGNITAAMALRKDGSRSAIGHAVRATLLMAGMRATAAGQAAGGSGTTTDKPDDRRETVVVVGSVSPEAFG